MPTKTEIALAKFYTRVMDASKNPGQLARYEMIDIAEELQLMREAPDPSDPKYSAIMVDSPLGKRARSIAADSDAAT